MTGPPGSSEAPTVAAGRPLLEAREARIAVDGVTAVDRLTLSTRGDRILFSGETAALFAALTGVPLSARGRVPGPDADGDEPSGEASVVAGSLLVAGASVADGAHHLLAGVAPLDPPLPRDWSVEQYVTWSARLSGASPAAARSMATAALNRIGFGSARRRALGSLQLPERRAAVLAQAIVTAPAVLIADCPAAGLEGAAATFVMEAIALATDGRRVLLSAARVDPASPEGELARAASQIVLLAGGTVVHEGSPAELITGVPLYALTVRTNASVLRAELAARGIDLRGGPTRFSAALPPGTTTRDLLLAARAAHAAVIELVPIVG